MKTAQIIEKIERDADKYLEFLNTVNEEIFVKTPGENVWSYAEVYSHVFESNLSSLAAMERCMYGNRPSSEGLSWMARFMFFFGKFPPFIELDAPARIAEKVQKISIEDARNSIFQFKKKLQEIGLGARKAPISNKIKHPRLGMLNANQWLRFIEIHTKHHLKQLEKITRIIM